MIKRQSLSRLLLLLLLSTAARAQQPPPPDPNAPMPRCGPDMDGQVFCKFGRIYECQLIDRNSMERRTGWRWTSDILRACTEPRPPPSPPPGLPPGFVYSPQNGSDPQSDDGPPERPGYYPGQRGMTYPYSGGSQVPYQGYRRN